MAGVNKCQFLGRLGKDPESKYGPSGGEISEFSLAVTETWNDKNGNRQEKTTWVKCVAFNKVAEVCNKYLKKGKQVQVFTKFQLDVCDRDGGGKDYFAKFILQEMPVFLGDAGGGKQAGSPKETPAQMEAFAKDDIPF